MSRIGKQPIAIPAKTKVEVKGQLVAVEGPKGKLEFNVPTPITVAVKDGNVIASTTQLDREHGQGRQRRLLEATPRRGRRVSRGGGRHEPQPLARLFASDQLHDSE